MIGKILRQKQIYGRPPKNIYGRIAVLWCVCVLKVICGVLVLTIFFQSDYILFVFFVKIVKTKLKYLIRFKINIQNDEVNVIDYFKRITIILALIQVSFHIFYRLFYTDNLHNFMYLFR